MITENGQFIVCSSVAMATTAVAEGHLLNHLPLYLQKTFFMSVLGRLMVHMCKYFWHVKHEKKKKKTCACSSNILCVTPRTRPLEQRHLPTMPPNGGATRGSGPWVAPGRSKNSVQWRLCVSATDRRPRWRRLTCTGRAVLAGPSTRPAGPGSSGAAPGSDWLSPHSRPRNKRVNK